MQKDLSEGQLKILFTELHLKGQGQWFTPGLTGYLGISASCSTNVSERGSVSTLRRLAMIASSSEEERINERHVT